MTISSSENCTTCRDSGWLLKTEGGVEQVVRCPECHSRAMRNKLLRRAQIPPRYLDRGFSVYSVHHPSQEKALTRAIDFVEAFPQVPRGLLLAGPCGVGKTHLSVAILKTLVLEKEVTGSFVDEAELLRRLHYSYGPDSPETEREVLLPLLEVDLLVWDDLGTGRPTEWVAETIRMIINHRYTYNKATILSTNWPLRGRSFQIAEGKRVSEQGLAERVGIRLYSRIMEMCEVLEVDGPDARTEIHKAGMDFQCARASKSSHKLAPEMLQCPHCDVKSPRILDQSKPKRDSTGNYIEISCQCSSCSKLFLARFFPSKKRVEYPSIP